MKKKLSAFAKIFGCETHYQGKTKTMFIHGERKDEVVDVIIRKFGRHIPIIIKAEKPISLQF